MRSTYFEIIYLAIWKTVLQFARYNSFNTSKCVKTYSNPYLFSQLLRVW